MSKYNIHTDVFKKGKCTYKVRISDFGKDEIVEHSDAPLLAPKIFIYNDDIQYNFKDILITHDNDLEIFIENLIEIKEFINNIQKKRGHYNDK